MDSIHVKHHPDFRWVIFVTMLITACLIGGFAYVWYRLQPDEARNLAEAKGTIQSLKDQIASLETIITGLKLEINQTEVSSTKPLAPVAPTVAPATYTSKHGFSFAYPGTWVLADTTIDEFPSLAAAEKVYGNHLAVASFDSTQYAGSDIPLDQAKLDIWVYTKLPQPTLALWAQTIKNQIKVEDFVISGKPSKKITFSDSLTGEPAITYFYIDGNTGVKFNLYPAATPLVGPVEDLIKSFKL